MDSESEIEGYQSSDGQSDFDDVETRRVRLLSRAPAAALTRLQAEPMSKSQSRLMNRPDHLTNQIHPLMR